MVSNMEVNLTPDDERLVRDRADLDDAWRKAQDLKTEWLEGEQVFEDLLRDPPRLKHKLIDH